MDKNLLIFLLIGLAIIGIAFGYPFLINTQFNNWSERGTFGDSYGFLNAIFSGLAFAGIIVTILIQRRELSLQREELKLQRAEMRETREEFLLNRTTNVIYNQLTRFEKAIQDFEIFDEGEYRAENAFLHLDSKKVQFYYSDNLTPEEELAEKQKINCQGLTFYSKFIAPLQSFSINAYNATQVVEETLVLSSLPAKQINELKNLYFRNIGFVYLGVIQDISEKTSDFFTLFKDGDLSKCRSVEFGELNHINIFLKSIQEFRETVINEETIEELRKTHHERFGVRE